MPPYFSKICRRKTSTLQGGEGLLWMWCREVHGLRVQEPPPFATQKSTMLLYTPVLVIFQFVAHIAGKVWCFDHFHIAFCKIPPWASRLVCVVEIDAVFRFGIFLWATQQHACCFSCLPTAPSPHTYRYGQDSEVMGKPKGCLYILLGCQH